MKEQEKDTFTNYIKDHVQIGIKEYKKILSLLPAPTKDKSLAELNSELSNEWDYTKNIPLTPFMFTPNSEKKVFWNCNKGHSWEASIKNRHRKKSGCPICYKENASEIVRSAILKKRGVTFGDKHPELLKEWDYELNKRSPFEISPGSSLKCHWVCSKNHKWKAALVGRTGKGYSCPRCSDLSRGSRLRKSLLSKGGVSLAEKYPELLNEWDFDENEESPHTYSPNSGANVNWKCNNGHKWIAQIGSRAKGIGNCQECLSITETNPELLNEWDYSKNRGVRPNQLKSGSNKKIWWICKKHGAYEKPVNEKLKGNGCQICAKIIKTDSYKQNILNSRGSLLKNRLELIKYWDYNKNDNIINPDKVTCGSHAKVWWVCEKNHKWQSSINTMTDKRRKYICRLCQKT